MNSGRKGNSFSKIESYLVSVIILTKKGCPLMMITCFLVIKHESYDAKAQKSVFPKKISFHNRIKVNAQVQTLHIEFCVCTRCTCVETDPYSL